jgi:hypothetical protein
MNALGFVLLSNRFWYGFFIGAMISLGAMILVAAAMKVRAATSR